jgi:hypothetical protein
MPQEQPPEFSDAAESLGLGRDADADGARAMAIIGAAPAREAPQSAPPVAGCEYKPASAETAEAARVCRQAERVSIATRRHTQLAESGALRPVLPAGCPTLLEMHANGSDPLPLVLRWAQARYYEQTVPSRSVLLKHFRRDYGPVTA